MVSGDSTIPFYQKILHIFLLSGFLFAQPLLDLIGANVEFLVARNAGPVEVYILLIALCLIIPSAIAIIESIARLAGKRASDATHTTLIFILSGCLFVLSLNKVVDLSGMTTVAVAIGLGIVTTYCYLKFSIFRLYLNFLSPAIFVIPVLFLLNSQVIKITSSHQPQITTGLDLSTQTPVVMVIFDELPTISLLDGNGLIDRVRYPNFSSLAIDAVWFRNATSISGQTTKSVPAILSGLRPEPEWLPIERDYPQTLFTLLKESHKLEVFETTTSLCPDLSCGGDIIVADTALLKANLEGLFSDISVVYLHLFLPEDFAKELPVISQTWKNFKVNLPEEKVENKRREYWKITRPEGFINFVNKIANSKKPGFYFIHTMMPHVPWKYLPSGQAYIEKDMFGVPGLDIKKERWGNNDWLVTQGYQRHLLQVSFIDKLLGKLFKRLKEQNLYDRSLIIVTADHGVSFWPNSSRRGITKPENRKEILGVPLLLKLPGQMEGSINDEPILTIDILPTVAHILGIDLPWETDGKNVLFSPSLAENKHKTKHPYADSMGLQRKLNLFGTGEQNDEGLYQIGFHKELIGLETKDIEIVENSDVSVSIDQSEELSSVDFSSWYIPAYITGILLNVKDNSDFYQLAIAVNGTIAAVTTSYLAKEEHQFSIIIPASSLRQGNNDINIFTITENKGVPSLSKLALRKLNRADTIDLPVEKA